jgi:DNA-binding transcriptional MocR family regulator
MNWSPVLHDQQTAIQPEELATGLGHWAGGRGPVYRQLADALKAAVTAGDLLPGRRLPAERQLARELTVSRSTVLAAFDLLKREGWLHSRQGSGTWLSRPDSATPPMAERGAAHSLRANPFLRPGARVPIDLATAALPAHPLVAEMIDALRARDVQALTEGHGYAPHGLPELRERVAAAFSAAGAATAADEVLVTTGTQQGLALSAALALRPGDVALVENPTSPGVLDALRAAGADIRGVPVGPRGARLDTLEELMTRLSPRLVVVVPTFHNPTAAVMPAGARRRLAAVAERLQILVAEDLSHADIVLGEAAPPPPLAHYAESHVLSLGSMSKLFWGGLRIGWVRAPSHLIARLSRGKATADLGTPLLSQHVAARLLARRDEVAQARREQLQPRLDRLETQLARRLPGWSWTRPSGGLSVWAQLPAGKATAFAQLAQRHGVSVVPGPLLSADESHERHLRISFAPGLAAITEGVDRLAAAWAEHTGAPVDSPAAVL